MKRLKNIFLLFLSIVFSLEAKVAVKQKFSVPLPKNFKRHMPTWDSLKRSPAPTGEKEIWVIIPSYNNKDWYKYNLDSVFGQNYSNYKVIYIDDCSPDGTGALVEAYVKEKKQEKRTLVLRNETREYALSNHYKAMHMCPDHVIAAVLDGDDWLSNPDALSLINRVYSEEDIWFTYGQWVSYPANKRGYCAPYPEYVKQKNLFRKVFWRVSQLRTCYAWLFKKIKKEDLQENGKFFAFAADVATIYPMIEMAGHRIKFIPDVIYIRNEATPINDFKVNKDEQRRISRKIVQSMKPYRPLLFKN